MGDAQQGLQPGSLLCMADEALFDGFPTCQPVKAFVKYSIEFVCVHGTSVDEKSPHLLQGGTLHLPHGSIALVQHVRSFP